MSVLPIIPCWKVLFQVFSIIKKNTNTPFPPKKNPQTKTNKPTDSQTKL